jgi:hypothetical protein
LTFVKYITTSVHRNAKGFIPEILLSSINSRLVLRNSIKISWCLEELYITSFSYSCPYHVSGIRTWTEENLKVALWLIAVAKEWWWEKERSRGEHREKIKGRGRDKEGEVEKDVGKRREFNIMKSRCWERKEGKLRILR